MIGVHRYKLHIWKFFLSLGLVFFRFNDIMFVSRNIHIDVFLKFLKFIKRVNFCSFSTCWFTKDELLRAYFSGFCLFSRNAYIKKHLSSVCCWQNCSLHLRLLPPYLPFLCSPTKNPKIRSLTTNRKYVKKCTV